jgi:hypothetical protein
MTAGSKSFTPQEFFEKLGNDELQGPLTLTGLVKVGEDSSTELMFAVGTHCADWTSVPLETIENVEVLDVVPCADHTHHRVTLTFKTPTSAEGAMFASLLSAATKRQSSPARVVRVLKGGSGAGRIPGQGAVLRDSGCPCNDYEIDASGTLWVRTECQDMGDGLTICTFEMA